MFVCFSAFIRSDNENGGKSVPQAPPNLVPPALPPKPGTVSINRKTHKHLWRLNYLHCLPALFPVVIKHMQVFQKFWPYRDILSRGISKEQQHGKLLLLEFVYITKRTTLPNGYSVYTVTYFKSNLSSAVRFSGHRGNTKVFFFGGAITL